MAGLGAHVTGVDISSEMLSAAKDEEKKEPLGIDYYECSFSSMPFSLNGSFDMVVSFMALMDGPDHEGAIAEFHRVLKPGGYLVFSITHPCFLTRDLRWILSEDGKEPRLVVGNYFSQEPFVESWKFSQNEEARDLPEFNVPNFPRTLSDYINRLIDSGFEIKRIQEPRPDKEACERYPALARWAQHAAIYLHLKVIKK